MKTKDVVRYENRFFVILEILPNGNYGCRCLNDGEDHVLRPNEVCLVRSYKKEVKPLKTKLYHFFEWMFSDECDKWMANKFFLFVKIAFIFCAAFTVFMSFKFLIELL